MLKLTVNYTDFNDVDHTTSVFFNLSKSEISMLEASCNGGLTAVIKRMANNDDLAGLVKFMEDFVLSAYGERSDDGKTFMKMDPDGRPLSRMFKQTAVYDAVFSRLFGENMEVEFYNFMRGVVPKEMRDKLPETLAGLKESAEKLMNED